MRCGTIANFRACTRRPARVRLGTGSRRANRRHFRRLPGPPGIAGSSIDIEEISDEGTGNLSAGKRSCVAVILLSLAADGAITPHALFSDGAVLQQKVKVPVWGTTDQKDDVTVSIAGQKVSATPAEGRWKVVLAPLAAGGPHVLTISQGQDKVEIKNVLVGEVWICGGQSNMQWTLKQSDGGSEAIATSANDKIRLFTVPRKGSDKPETNVEATWAVAGPEHVAGFFGRGLLLRSRPAKATQRAGRADRLELRRHRRRAMDEQGVDRFERRTEGHVEAAGRQHALQRHDRSLGAVRHPGRDLVSGRVERRPRVSVSQRCCRP